MRFDIRRYLPAQNCALCAAVSGAAALCQACAEELPTLGPACPICALPQSASEICGACMHNPPYYDATFGAFRYAYPLDRLVQALKFHGQLVLAGFFAEHLARAVAGRPRDGVPVLMPMPLHRNRLAERGFNQAVEMGRHVARITGIGLAVRGARRIRDTASQTGLPPARRESNVREAFRCDADVAGCTVAVIDDVMTTGATLNELARALKRAGAARVENWVVARTVLDD